MTASTGKELSIYRGTSRIEVIKQLGEPKERRTDINGETTARFISYRTPVSYIEIFRYRGKLNAPDEGGGQAIINALTLGTAEVAMIPLTTADIAIRSVENNLIYVFFDSNSNVVDVETNPRRNFFNN